jgi:hypothetical protein
MSGDSWYSYKHGATAVNFQVACNGMKVPIWTDYGHPAGVHDVRAVWRSTIGRIVNQEEKGMGDLGYLNDRLPVLIITPYKRAANQDLTDAQDRYNKRFNAVRARIEQLFGVLKLHFDSMREGFRGDVEWLPTLFRLALTFTSELIVSNLIQNSEYLEAVALIREEERTYYEDLVRLQQDEGDVARAVQPDELPQNYRIEQIGRVRNIVEERQDENEDFEITAHHRSRPQQTERRLQLIQQRRRDGADAYMQAAQEQEQEIRRLRETHTRRINQALEQERVEQEGHEVQRAHPFSLMSLMRE